MIKKVPFKIAIEITVVNLDETGDTVTEDSTG